MCENRTRVKPRYSRLHVFSIVFIPMLLSAVFSASKSFAGVYTEVRVGESVILTVPYQVKRYSVTVQEQSVDSSNQGVKIEKNAEPKSPALVQVIYAVPDHPVFKKMLVKASDPPAAPDSSGGKTEIKIDGEYPGKATLIVWDKDEHKQFFDVNVVMDTTDLKAAIDAIARDDASHINIKTLGTTIIVTGSVSTQERRARIDNVLKSVAYNVKSKELDFLQGGQTRETQRNNGNPDDKTIKYVDLLEVANAPEIDLQITVASIDRNALRNLGINWAYAGRNVTIDSAIAPVSPGLTAINSLVSGSHDLPLTTTGINGANIGVVHSPSGTQYLIQALATKGLARVLASPDLLVRDGEVGSFLAGGEFPVPVVQSGNIGGSASNGLSISVVWKKFGVMMNMKPVVKEDGNIEINMENNRTRDGNYPGNGEDNCGIEVSSLDYADAVLFNGFKIPALKEDHINTNVELKDGETFVVGGLLSEDWTRTLDKVPLLGDIPIIGAFFRDQALTRNERELVFFITPKLAKAMAPGVTPSIPGANEPTPEQKKALQFIPGLPNSISTEPLKLK